MSDALRHKLRAYQDTRNITALLTQVDGITFDQFVEPSELPLSLERYEAMNERTPTWTTILPENLSRAGLQQQAIMMLEQAQISDRCYLKLSDFRDTPWAAIQVVPGSTWVNNLWMRLRLHDFRLLNPDCTILLTIREREYDYIFSLRHL